MEKIEIRDILEKFDSGILTAEEEEIAKLWLSKLNNNDRALLSEDELEDASTRIWERLKANRPAKPIIFKLWPGFAAAGAVALMIFGVYFFSDNQQKTNQVPDLAMQNIAPGHSGATLTLGNGKQIRLTDALKGQLAEESGVSIEKSPDGRLVYQIKDSESSKNKTNTLSTAPGETYQVRLPDGSIVWLNSSSSLTYSVRLLQDEKRLVKLVGEGYFEVFKDRRHPFIVKTEKQEVEVLGTHFNINAYTNEMVTKTTLLEGSVRVADLNNQNHAVLEPNQQSEVSGNAAIKVKPINTEDAVAWKKGYFRFNTTPVDEVMRQLERWYNIQVVYEKDANRSAVIEGTVSRFASVSRLLKTIENTGVVKFRVEGNKVYVSN